MIYKLKRIIDRKKGDVSYGTFVNVFLSLSYSYATLQLRKDEVKWHIATAIQVLNYEVLETCQNLSNLYFFKIFQQFLVNYLIPVLPNQHLSSTHHKCIKPDQVVFELMIPMTNRRSPLFPMTNHRSPFFNSQLLIAIVPKDQSS